MSMEKGDAVPVRDSREEDAARTRRLALALLLQDRPRLTCGVLAVQVMVSVVYTWQYLHGWPIY